QSLPMFLCSTRYLLLRSLLCLHLNTHNHPPAATLARSCPSSHTTAVFCRRRRGSRPTTNGGPLADNRDDVQRATNCRHAVEHALKTRPGVADLRIEARTLITNRQRQPGRLGAEMHAHWRTRCVLGGILQRLQATEVHRGLDR